jgi:HSP20 family protein
MTIVRQDPIRELFPSTETLMRLFDDMLLRPRSEWMSAFRGVPAVDMYESNDTLKVEVPLPGIKLEELEVTVVGNTLTIKGERKAKKEVKEEDYLRQEVHYGAFTRSVALPTVVDSNKGTASYDAGVLTITFPKTAEAAPKKLEVKAA